MSKKITISFTEKSAINAIDMLDLTMLHMGARYAGYAKSIKVKLKRELGYYDNDLTKHIKERNKNDRRNDISW